MDHDIKPKADFFVEVLHEVANPIGGVYTVAVTKSTDMRKYYGDNFWSIGAYYPKYAKIEFEEKMPSLDIKNLFKELEKEKIFCHYGTWLIPGKPRTVLIDYSKRMNLLPKIKKRLKKQYDVDTKNCGSNVDKQLVWSDCVSRLFEEFFDLKEFEKKKGIVHYHLSDAGLSLLNLAKSNPPVGIVYTAHSTRLGRYIVMGGGNIINEIKRNKNKTIKRGREYKYGGMVKTVHQFERACAKVADVFTSVSESTAIEAKYILGRKTDVVTPNGLDFSAFPSMEERAILHITSKNKIYRFLNAYFLPYYQIDIPNSLLFFTSGRYELTTKGYDILFDALSKLNARLKKEDYQNTIFVFLFIMLENKDANEDLLGNMAVYDAIEHLVADESSHIDKRIISALAHGQGLTRNILFDEHFLMESKKLMLRFKRKKGENPPISAFRGLEKDDPVMKSLIKCGLDNEEDDKVKVIFYPAPVSVGDGLLSMGYHEVASGMHLGVFPSLYEPWGYTPLETAANAVISITTDISGFGKFVTSHSDLRKKEGILILRTEMKKRIEIVDELAKMMHSISKLSRKERIDKKLEARKIAQLADWGEMAKEYIKAHNLAIDRCKARQKKK